MATGFGAAVSRGWTVARIPVVARPSGVLCAIGRERFFSENRGQAWTTLSEVVHCKSISEQGVWSALEPCAQLYIQRVLGAAGAPVIVVLGEIAGIPSGRPSTWAIVA